jgi:hypothetical protein
VLNACKLLFNHSEKLDTQLFKALCKGIPDPRHFALAQRGEDLDQAYSQA